MHHIITYDVMKYLKNKIIIEKMCCINSTWNENMWNGIHNVELKGLCTDAWSKLHVNLNAVRTYNIPLIKKMITCGKIDKFPLSYIYTIICNHRPKLFKFILEYNNSMRINGRNLKLSKYC